MKPAGSRTLATVTLGTRVARVRKEYYVRRRRILPLLICKAEKQICQTLHSIVTARCYAYPELCRRKMSVRLSVCHTPVFCRNG